MINNYNEIASIYAKDNNFGTAYLAFKNLPMLLEKYCKGKVTLDYGCGSGFSSRFLSKLGFSVQGVDISQSMLDEAISAHDNIPYRLVKSAELDYPDETFNLVFSSFVLFEISTKTEMCKILNEIYRVLKKGGLFLAITGTTDMYKYPWLTLDTNFSENKTLNSGSIAKVYLKDIDLYVYDYYWTDTDYNDVIRKTKFQLLEKHFPYGDDKDGYKWISEKSHSPYVIYILKK